MDIKYKSFIIHFVLFLVIFSSFFLLTSCYWKPLISIHLQIFYSFFAKLCEWRKILPLTRWFSKIMEPVLSLKWDWKKSKDSPVLNCNSFHEKLSKNPQASRGSFDSGNWSLVLDKMPKPKAWVQKCETRVHKFWIKSLLLVSFPEKKTQVQKFGSITWISFSSYKQWRLRLLQQQWYSKRADSSLLCAPFASSSTTKPACDHVYLRASAPQQ